MTRFWGRGPRIALAVAALFLMGGCGDSPTAVLFADVESTWSYTMSVGEIDSTPEPGDLACRVTDATLTLTGRSTFTGALMGGVTCTVIGEEPFAIAFSDRVSEGLIEEDNVRFWMGLWRHTGTFTDSTMTGAVDVVGAFGGSVRTVTGAWSAVRQ